MDFEDKFVMEKFFEVVEEVNNKIEGIGNWGYDVVIDVKDIVVEKGSDVVDKMKEIFFGDFIFECF